MTLQTLVEPKFFCFLFCVLVWCVGICGLSVMYTYVWIHMPMYTGAHIYECTHGDQRSTLSSSVIPHLMFWDRISLWPWNPLFQLDWLLVGYCRPSICPHLLACCQDYRCMLSCLTLVLVVIVLIQSLHLCNKALSTKPSSRSLNQVLKMLY